MPDDSAHENDDEAIRHQRREALLYVLNRGIIKARSEYRRFPKRTHDLLDAIHNIPETARYPTDKWYQLTISDMHSFEKYHPNEGGKTWAAILEGEIKPWEHHHNPWQDGET